MESTSRVYGFIDNTRDLTLEAALGAITYRKDKPLSAPIPATQLKKLLESRHEAEVLEGLRRVVSLTQHRSPEQISHLLPTVLKNISSTNTHIRKLVYIVLLHNAESEPDTALLAINSIQKSLSASDAHLRALALRTISSLRVPVIAQIVSLGIKHGAGDLSPIVRRTAAFAIPKCWRLDPSTAPQLEAYLAKLLGDRQYFVAGAAVMAFNECCPERIDMIHQHYRVLVRMLIDMDEWSQLATLRMLTCYARRCFPRQTQRVKRGAEALKAAASKDADFYDDSTADAPQLNLDQDENSQPGADFETVDVYDPDLELLFKTSQSLLSSRSSAVIVAVASMYIALATPSASPEPSSYILSTVGPLVALLRASPATSAVALQNILQVLMAYPQPFVRYARHFLLRARERPDVSALKLEALGLIYPHAPQHVQSLILAELTHAASSPDSGLVRSSIAAIGRCAQAAGPDSTMSQRCLRLLLSQVSSPYESSEQSPDAAAAPALATSEALTQIRHLIQSNPTAHVATVIRLAKDLDTTTQPNARATIVWLVGEHASTDVPGDSPTGQHLGSVAADVLRILAKGFADEDEPVKRQILVLAAKLYLHHLNSQPPASDGNSGNGNGEGDSASSGSSPVPLLYAYVHHLVRYDTSYPLRDLARTHRALLPVPSLSTAPTGVAASGAPPSALTTQLATLLLNAPKPAPVLQSPSSQRQGLRLGSASLVVGPDAGAHGLKGYEELPAWVAPGQEPDPGLRNAGGVAGAPRREAATFAAQGGARPAAAALDAAVEARPPKVEKSLDDWLDEEDEEKDEEEEESSEEDSSEEEESTEEESEEDEAERRLVQ